MTCGADDGIRFVGFAPNGVPIFDAELAIPPPAAGFDIPSTPAQKAAVTDLFGEIGDVTGTQASAILDARNYGRQCARRLFGRYPAKVRDQMAVVIAVYVLADPERLRDVITWGTRRFNSSPDGSAIARTKRFPEIREWVCGLMAGTDCQPER